MKHEIKCMKKRYFCKHEWEEAKRALEGNKQLVVGVT